MLRRTERSVFGSGLVFALAVALLLGLPTLGRCAEGDSSTTRQILQSQLATVNRQLDDAQRELSAIPDPNYCCCIGAFVLAPVIGGIFWYFVDIKPKEDKKHQLEARIQSLTEERHSLQMQLMMLQK